MVDKNNKWNKSKSVLNSKGFRNWRRAKKLKVALAASIGVASLGGGLVAGFALKPSNATPAINAYITENNLQIGNHESYAILNITETSKKEWKEPTIDVGDSDLKYEQTGKGTYKLTLGTQTLAKTHEIVISVEGFNTIPCSVTVIPAREITAKTTGDLQFDNGSKTVDIIVTSHNGATLPTGQLEHDGFIFSSFAPINETETRTTVQWDGAPINTYSITISEGDISTQVNLNVVEPHDFIPSITNNELQYNNANGSATLTVVEKGMEWVDPAIDQDSKTFFQFDENWIINPTNNTGSITFKLKNSSPAAKIYERSITLSLNDYGIQREVPVTIRDAFSFSVGITLNTFQPMSQAGECRIRLTQTGTDVWVVPNIDYPPGSFNDIIWDTQQEGLDRYGTLTAKSILSEQTYTLGFVINGERKGIDIQVSSAKSITALVQSNDLQVGELNSEAVLKLTGVNIPLSAEPNVVATSGGDQVSGIVFEWVEDSTDTNAWICNAKIDDIERFGTKTSIKLTFNATVAGQQYTTETSLNVKPARTITISGPNNILTWERASPFSYEYTVTGIQDGEVITWSLSNDHPTDVAITTLTSNSVTLQYSPTSSTSTANDFQLICKVSNFVHASCNIKYEVRPIVPGEIDGPKVIDTVTQTKESFQYTLKDSTGNVISNQSLPNPLTWKIEWDADVPDEIKNKTKFNEQNGTLSWGYDTFIEENKNYDFIVYAYYDPENVYTSDQLQINVKERDVDWKISQYPKNVVADTTEQGNFTIVSGTTFELSGQNTPTTISQGDWKVDKSDIDLGKGGEIKIAHGASLEYQTPGWYLWVLLIDTSTHEGDITVYFQEGNSPTRSTEPIKIHIKVTVRPLP